LQVSALIVAGLLLLSCIPAEAPAAAPPEPFLRVLGTAQDGGLPHASCWCERCRAAREDPARRRLVASLALVLPASDEIYLIDAGPDIRAQLDALDDLVDNPRDRANRAPLAGVFLTHAHLGHYTGLSFFGFEAVHTRELPVFATPRMAGYLRENGPWSQLVSLNNIALNETVPGAFVELSEGVRLRSLPVPHRDEFSDTVGYVIEGRRKRVLYVPDTDTWSRWDPPLLEQLRDIDIVLVDGTFFSLDELPGRDLTNVPHPLMTQTIELLQPRVDAGTLEVFFTHLNHSNPALDPAGDAAALLLEHGFHILADGQQIEL